MTNLPIISPPSNSSGNAANVAQANNMADSQSAEGLRSDGSPAEASGPFAALLAKQLGGPDLPSANSLPGAIATDSDTQPSKNKQEEAVPADAPGEQANMLAAMLLQLPPEMRTPPAGDATGTSTARNDASGIDASASSGINIHLPSSRNDTSSINASASQSMLPADAKPGMTNTAPGKADAAATPTDKRIIADAISQDRVNRVELAASQSAPGTNTAQLIASSTIPAMMPNMLIASRPADTAQTIATPLGDGNWAEDFSQKISWMSTQKNQVAELHLSPPDLGPLNVVLKVSDNQATAMFASPHSAVREAVENAIPRLREILAENGITLGNTTVSDQPARDRSTEGSNQGSGTAAQRAESDGASASPDSVRTLPARRHNGMVDTFA